MSSSLKQVEKQLAAIEQSSKALANELHQTFLNYLKFLGNAVKKQLILASYYLCTQGYPDAFLSLSFKEKQELQSAIRQNALSAVQDLSILLTLTLRIQQNLSSQTERDNADNLANFVNFLEELEESAPLDEDEIDEDKIHEDELDEDKIHEDEIDEDKIHEINERIFAQGREEIENPWAGIVLTNPERISQWHKTLEQGIVEILRTASRKTNESLQEYKILPKNLPDIPDILLELGAKASGYAEPMGNLPNIVNLTIEIGNDAEGEKSSKREKKSKDVINILKINLRLSDIEFADPLLMAKRNQIRELSHRLNSLLKEYQKKQQERIIAEAEAAWRSSWFEE
jgi:hypothetical protein